MIRILEKLFTWEKAHISTAWRNRWRKNEKSFEGISEGIDKPFGNYCWYSLYNKNGSSKKFPITFAVSPGTYLLETLQGILARIAAMIYAEILGVIHQDVLQKTLQKFEEDS